MSLFGLFNRGLPYTGHRRPGVDDELQYPDSVAGVVTRNRLQEAEGFERDNSENPYTHPTTTDPWDITT